PRCSYRLADPFGDLLPVQAAEIEHAGRPYGHLALQRVRHLPDPAKVAAEVDLRLALRCVDGRRPAFGHSIRCLRNTGRRPHDMQQRQLALTRRTLQAKRASMRPKLAGGRSRAFGLNRRYRLGQGRDRRRCRVTGGPAGTPADAHRTRRTAAQIGSVSAGQAVGRVRRCPEDPRLWISQALRIEAPQRGSRWCGNPETACLVAHGIRRSVKPQPDRLRVHAGKPPDDQPRGVQHRPAARTRTTVRPVGGRRQAETDDVGENRGLSQSEIEADRLETLPGRYHAGEQPVEGGPDRGDKALVSPIALDRGPVVCNRYGKARWQLAPPACSGGDLNLWEPECLENRWRPESRVRHCCRSATLGGRLALWLQRLRELIFRNCPGFAGQISRRAGPRSG